MSCLYIYTHMFISTSISISIILSKIVVWITSSKWQWNGRVCQPPHGEWRILQTDPELNRSQFPNRRPAFGTGIDVGRFSQPVRKDDKRHDLPDFQCFLQVLDSCGFFLRYFFKHLKNGTAPLCCSLTLSTWRAGLSLQRRFYEPKPAVSPITKLYAYLVRTQGYHGRLEMVWTTKIQNRGLFLQLPAHTFSKV